MPSFTLKTPVQIAPLLGEDVHVWKVNLLHDFSGVAKSVLSEDEQVKINRLRSLKHQRYATSMRVQLRQLLAVYLAVDAKEVQFAKGEFGKPYILNSKLSFNISHSEDQALVAVSQCTQLGVDIECWRELGNLEGLVKRNFSEAEKQQWLDVAIGEREATFFKIWTRKEAFIKATGRGLGMGVSTCGFNLQSPHNIKLSPSEYGATSSWQCYCLDVGERVSASLIIQAESCELKIYHFDPVNKA